MIHYQVLRLNISDTHQQNVAVAQGRQTLPLAHWKHKQCEEIWNKITIMAKINAVSHPIEIIVCTICPMAKDGVPANDSNLQILKDLGLLVDEDGKISKFA